jgi:cyclopropane-fatty-acyl-phospholipid synthase
MIARLAPRPSAPAAADVLRRVFGHVRAPFAFRLWDGTEVGLGEGPPACTVVVHRPETFARLMDDPSPGHFAEAYVSSQIDIEGDLLAAMGVANEVEDMRLGLRDKLAVLRRLRRA